MYQTTRYTVQTQENKCDSQPTRAIACGQRHMLLFNLMETFCAASFKVNITPLPVIQGCFFSPSLSLYLFTSTFLKERIYLFLLTYFTEMQGWNTEGETETPAARNWTKCFMCANPMLCHWAVSLDFMTLCAKCAEWDAGRLHWWHFCYQLNLSPPGLRGQWPIWKQENSWVHMKNLSLICVCL